jgi:uncharacterized protein
MNSLGQPVTSGARIQSLDVLRGIAILGIFIMNIQSLSMPGAAYMNPMAYGDMTGLNKWVWILGHVFADQKFMTIFSILYGAGIVLITDKAESKGGKPRSLHYRRNFWLLIIGLIHAHLIWYGDILVTYALCAMLAYWLRNLSPWKLIFIGALLISVHSLFYIFSGLSLDYWPEESITQTVASWKPDETHLSREIDAVTGSLGEQIAWNSKEAVMMETFVFLMVFFWRAGGLILIGMALYKLGVLSAKRSRLFYTRLWIISWALGLPIVVYGLVQNFAENWSFEYSMFLGSQFNYWGSIGVSLGYIALVMLFVKMDGLNRIKSRLAAVGQMALTNYLSQSIIGIFIFFGIGFGLFGQVERSGQILVVFGVWALQLLWSEPWLARYKFGPFEWAWRSLTYNKRQALKRN